MDWLLVLRWLLVLAVLTGVGAPLAAWLFADLPRRGAAFSLPVALVGVALVTFWVGQVTVGLHAVLLASLAVAGLSGLAVRDGALPAWRAVAAAYGVFAAGFLVLVVFRASNPGITPAGGEQFLHFGLTKAIARSPALPPEDFWFAGEPVRYYYGTQLQVTSLSLLTDTPLRSGFNLGLATFYGVLVVSAYGLAGAVASAAGYSAGLGGVLGIFFAAVAGALTTAVRLAVGLLPEDVALEYGRAAFGAIRHMPYEEAVASQSDPGSWGWFFTRYVVPGTLQEFPLYSFVKGDLHGHALSTGFVVLAAALAYSYYRLPADRRQRRLAVLLGGLGGVAGVFGFMNTWSLPTAAGLTWLAVAAATAHPATLLPPRMADRLRFADAVGNAGPLARLRAEAWRLVLAAVPAGLVGLVGVALASPFLVFGLVPQNDGVGLFPPRTSLAPFLIVYGSILALFAGYLVWRGWPAVRRADRRTVAAGAAGGLVVGLSLLTILSFPVLAMTGPVLLGAWWLVRTDRAGYAAVMFVAGVGLLLSMEVVFAKVDPWPQLPRWNTTLKVAVQGWTLAGVASGAASAILLGAARERLGGVLSGRDTGATGGESSNRSVRRLASPLLAVGLVAAVILASAPFPVLVAAHEVGAHVDDGGDLSLDGLGIHERWKGEELAAIDWLDRRTGRPTIVEAPGEDVYRWTNPASSLTGLPTIVGWSAHEDNYRPRSMIETRVAAVEVIYAGEWSAAAEALREYDVEYVYVGPEERERYGDRLQDFSRHDGLSVAFQNEAVTIHRVDRAAL